jgi:hypothetical protein
MSEDLDELENDNSAVNPAIKENKPLKPRQLVIVAGLMGVCCFFLPWLKLSILGFEVYSIIGLDIPTTADMVGQWTVSLGGSSNGVSIFSLLYLIPLLFIAIIILELTVKRHYIPYLAWSIIILLFLFVGGLIYKAGFNEVLNLLSVGLYSTLIASIILVFLSETVSQELATMAKRRLLHGSCELRCFEPSRLTVLPNRLV